MSWTSFARALLARSVKLKALLMDQEVVAGIGPIYSDEILWEAGLRYDRISSELSSQEIRRLFRALVETLHDAVKHRGTTVDDYPFVDLYGKPGDHQDELKVYGREGEPCRRCRAPSPRPASPTSRSTSARPARSEFGIGRPRVRFPCARPLGSAPGCSSRR